MSNLLLVTVECNRSTNPDLAKSIVTSILSSDTSFISNSSTALFHSPVCKSFKIGGKWANRIVKNNAAIITKEIYDEYLSDMEGYAISYYDCDCEEELLQQWI